MTVNELIEKLKEYGDEKARDMGKVRIVDSAGNLFDDNIDIFDVKFDVHGVTIPVNTFSSNNCGYEDDDDYWGDDELDDELDDEDDEEDEEPYIHEPDVVYSDDDEDEEEENDSEDYGWGQDGKKD